MKNLLKIVKILIKLPANVCLKLIWIYQKAISPMFPPCCRFHPTCSSYSAQAFRSYGFLKGLWLTVWRISKCQPFYRGDFFDPVPPSKNGD